MRALVVIVAWTSVVHADAVYGVQRTSTSGAPLWRDSRTIAMAIDPEISAAARPAIEAGFHAWEPATSLCGEIAFSFGADATARVHVITTAWPHEPGVASVTSLDYLDDPSDPDDGKILSADVDLDAVDFELLLPGATPVTGKPALDLQSVVTHEAGHVLGLDHDCAVAGASWPTDEAGARVPACDAPSLPASVLAATMFYKIEPNDTAARTPAPNDVAGACAIIARSPAPEVTGGCAATAPGGLLIALLPWLLRARRRRPCDRERSRRHGAAPSHPALRDPRPARPRRDGQGLSRTRSPARP